MIYGAWGVAQIADWLSGKTVKAMLVDATYVQAVDDTLAAATAHQVTGTGYTTGGVTVTSSLSVTLDVPTSQVRLLCAPVNFGAVVITGVAGIVFYAGTVPIAADLFDPVDVNSTGTTFTYTPPAAGLAVLTIESGDGGGGLGGTGPVVPAGTRFAGDPGTSSLYYGSAVHGGDPTSRETYAGTHVGCFRSYFEASQNSANVARASRDLGLNRLPIISSKMPDTWGAMAAGSQDAWIDSLMTAYSALSGPVWFCPHHEPYDDQGGSGMAPSNYVAMCERFMDRKAANVAIVPIMQSYPFDRTLASGTHNLSDWYSVDSHDIVGLDSYNHWSAVYNSSGVVTGSVNHWRSVTQVFSVAEQVTWGKPIAFCEWGVRTDPSEPGKAAAWMAEARNFLIDRGDVVASVFYDSDLNVGDGGTPWSLDDHGTERLVRWRTDLNATNAVL